LPAGVLNVVTGGIDVGEMLSSDKRVDMVTFTGSDLVGAAVMKQAAPGLKRVLLELGGKSALIVRADANVAAAAQSGVANFTIQAGQGCALCTRHLVHNSIKDAYTDTLKMMTSHVKVGDPVDAAISMGPLIRDSQRARVEHYVAEGLRQGARLVTGGKRPEHLERGFFYEPTVFTDLDNSAIIAQEEIFGPVAVVIGFDTDEEAVAIANDSPYGLSGSIFSADVGAAFEMATEIRTGQVHLNGGMGVMSSHVPFGGFKRSGIGREFGKEGLLEYMQTKAITFHAG
ncbi:MAG: aldehyde dehydrogenase family protein, partial [Kordiimonadaceae bacterium]|nr:aldehyde dehydrogenase family protein [Kordiimonadaceae bacterium]